VAKCKYLTMQHVSRTASVVEVSASFIAVVFSVTVYNWMGKASGVRGRSKDASFNIRFEFCM